MDRFRGSAASHPGSVRSHNEDTFISRPDIGLWAVADGAGGHEAGEVAADLIARSLTAIPGDLGAAEMLGEVRLRLAETHEALLQEAARRGSGAVIASTVVVLIARAGHFACLWAGDSRAYRLRDGDFARLTHDHSLVQELVDSGHITATEAEHHPRANIITRAVGVGEEALELDKVTDRLEPGDRFLLCSDGLTKELGDGEIGQILGDRPSEAAADDLLAAALAHGARDNVTAVVLEVIADERF